MLEERGEELRLAYVALTRAKHQAVIWWAGAWDSQHSPLGRLLLASEPSGNVAADGGSTIPQDATVLARLEELVGDGARVHQRRARARRSEPQSWNPPIADVPARARRGAV